jgi:hypothetical protein
LECDRLSVAADSTAFAELLDASVTDDAVIATAAAIAAARFPVRSWATFGENMTPTPECDPVGGSIADGLAAEMRAILLMAKLLIRRCHSDFSNTNAEAAPRSRAKDMARDR